MDLDLVEFGRARSALPPGDPPSADAAYEERAAWSERYVTWRIAQMEQDGALPSDVRATHLYEIEFVSCVDDPQAYVRAVEEERQTQRVH